MSTDLPQQVSPIIIKGGSKTGIFAKAIEIHADGDFSVTVQFQSQPDEWIQSDSDFSISYIESVVIGPMGPEQQYCQTSTMAHPLTFEFQDSAGDNIFTIQEAVDGSNFSLQISVDSANSFFQITEQSKSSSEVWTVSTFNTADLEVAAVEVKDAGNIPVCRLLRAVDEDIYIELEPS